MTSNPCLNGGICLSPSPGNRKRFACKCSDGYEGERCQVMKCSPGYTGEHCEQPIKSCRGYSNGSRVPGNYTVINSDLGPFQVFCDFDSDSPMTWTLILSYKLENREDFRTPLFTDSPINQNEPSWSRYRLSKSEMESIQEDSTQWRITCRYETDGVVYTDYVRALNNEANILHTYDISTSCVKVEYINVRDQSCTQCTVMFWQTNNYGIFHFDSYYENFYSCSFKTSGYLECNRDGEDNFGWYYCNNYRHRCSSSDEATTQTWFGGGK